MGAGADRGCRATSSPPRRGLFEDGANSFWHVAFGMAACHVSVGAAVYAAYQVRGFADDVNFPVDMLEFLVGYAAMYALRRALSRRARAS